MPHYNPSDISRYIPEQLNAIYAELSALEELFAVDSKHVAYLAITKRMEDILRELKLY